MMLLPLPAGGLNRSLGHRLGHQPRCQVFLPSPATALRRAALKSYCREQQLRPVYAHAQAGQSGAVTSPQTSCTDFEEAAAAEYAIPDAAAGFAAVEMQPLMASHNVEPPQSLFDDQLAHLIGEQPQFDDFEEVAQQLPIIKAELGDQQQLLAACNQFLEDMAERHLSLLMQQQSAQRMAAQSSTESTQALDLQAVTQLEQQLQEVTGQLQLQRQQTADLLEHKEKLNKQLRIVTMEREELRQQLQLQEQTTASGPTQELQDTLSQLSDLQEQLLAAEQKLTGSLDTNRQLTEQLQQANSEAAAAKASALAATGTTSAAVHAQLQEMSAKVAALESQLAAAEQHNGAVSDSNKVLQYELHQAHDQGGRLISMNRQLIQHAEKLAGQHEQQETLVSSLKADKAAMAAELGRIYIMLQEMQSAQQRQQQLHTQLVHIIAQQQHVQAGAKAPQAKPAQGSTASSSKGPGDHTGKGTSDASTAAGEAAEPPAANPLVQAVSGAVRMFLQ